MSNELITFNFTDATIRTALISNKPYFCLKDCAKALGIKDCTDRIFKKGTEIISTLTNGGMQKLTFVNEPNLYRLVFRSRKPQAQAFADWVYSEVLPSIRKTGGYGLSAQVDMNAIGGMVKKCCAVAVRQELNAILAGDPKADWEVTDKDLIFQLQRWHATKAKADTEEFRRLYAENEELKKKIAAIKKAVR